MKTLANLKKSSHASSSKHHESFGEESLKINEYYQPQPRRTRRERQERESPREVRVDLPHFHGKENVEIYLDWEMKVEQLFVCHKVSKENKVPLATLSFQGNAMYWWTTLERDRRLHKDPPIEYWNDLRGALRRRHIPSYYNRELMDKLQRLQQKTMSVEKYRQKMELYMMRALRETSSRREDSYPNSYPIREFKREESVPKEKPRETPKSVGKDMLTPPIRPRDVKCFKCYGRGHVQAQCPNQRTLLLRGVDEYSSCDDVPSGKQEENNERVYPCEGELMMIRRTLNNQTSVNLETQRENIFHTRCKVLENICSLIVDSGSCCNCCSVRMVEKLNLQLVPHPTLQTSLDQ